MPSGALVTGQSLRNQHDSLSEAQPCEATFLLAMALQRASPCRGRHELRQELPAQHPSPEPAAGTPPCSLGAGRGTAGSFCSHCIRRANVRKWNLTQFMKRSSLSLAALCCHKPGRLGEGCEQWSCRAGGAACGQEPQQGWSLRGIKICPWGKKRQLKSSHTDRRSQPQGLKTQLL